MSTTLLPPSSYVVKPRGQVARHYETIAQAATAIARLACLPATVSVVTGKRSRSLTEAELHELARHVRAHRLYSNRPSDTQRSRPE